MTMRKDVDYRILEQDWMIKLGIESLHVTYLNRIAQVVSLSRANDCRHRSHHRLVTNLYTRFSWCRV